MKHTYECMVWSIGDGKVQISFKSGHCQFAEPIPPIFGKLVSFFGQKGEYLTEEGIDLLIKDCTEANDALWLLFLNLSHGTVLSVGNPTSSSTNTWSLTFVTKQDRVTLSGHGFFIKY